MLEKPDLPDDKIIACLQADYGLHVATIAFLPLGADLNTAVYRVTADDGTSYFLKLRSGVFDETSVALPKFLSDQGIAQVIAPLATSTGQLWANLDAFKVILYPFIEGRNGYEVDLVGSPLDRVWRGPQAHSHRGCASRVDQIAFSGRPIRRAGARSSRHPWRALRLTSLTIPLRQN